MKLERLEYPYNQDWDYGYLYTDKKNNRTIIKLQRGDKKYSTLYARYLLAVKLGRYLTKDETVDHIDNNPLNDSVDNLQVLTREENAAKYRAFRGEPEHGKYQRYHNGCRCEACMEAARLKIQRYRANKKLRETGLLTVKPNPRLIAREIINRPLKRCEVVHFIDGNSENLNLSNMVIFATHTDYNRFIKYGSDMKFASKQDDGIYIVKSLSHKAHNPAELRDYECELCHKEFRAYRATRRCEHIYCSRECAAQAGSAKRIADTTGTYEKVHIEKEQLLADFAELKSYRAVATKYGLSDNAIKKKCIKYEILDVIKPIVDANKKAVARANNPMGNISEAQRQNYRDRQKAVWESGALDHIKKPVNAYDKETGKLVASYNSMGDAGRLGFAAAQIRACCKGTIKSYKGFIWRFANNEEHTSIDINTQTKTEETENQQQ